jgi:hypothetical protein
MQGNDLISGILCWVWILKAAIKAPQDYNPIVNGSFAAGGL